MKTCSKCKVEKQKSEFNTDNSREDKVQNYCKKCTSDYKAIYNKTKRGVEVARGAVAKYKLKFPEKISAGDRIRTAVWKGKMQKSVFCEECGLPAETQGHHEDYNRPLEVIWVCPDCHMRLHQNSLEIVGAK